jgi:RimJ/RimL family protein N-acetyltransferase
MTAGTASPPVAPIGEPVDATPAPLPQRLTLEGRRVTLRPLSPDLDLAPLWRVTHGAAKNELWLYLFEGPFADATAFAAYLERNAASDDPLFFAIVDRATNLAAGYASLLNVEPRHRTVEVGHILYGEGLQRSAGATEAMFLLARHVFDDLGYRRYEWKCNALNAPSRRAATRLGFRYEGTFRQHFIIKGRNRDTAWYSMLDGEWPERKAAFEAWLDPANFDAQGGQRRSLSSLTPVAGGSGVAS